MDNSQEVSSKSSYPDRETVTVEEAAKILGIGRSCAYEAVHRGEIPSLRVGRRFLIPKAQLKRLLGDDRSM
jgi:excisionase family DNA binding protein